MESYNKLVEVIEALKGLTEYKNVEDIEIRKRNEKGGFSQRIILKGEK